MSNFETQYQSKHPYKTAGTYMTAAGTLIAGVTNKVLKIHQYNISALGTIDYSLNNAKPTGGTIDWGMHLEYGVAAKDQWNIVKPFLPYPGCLCCTIQIGSALCLGTYGSGIAGTVFFQAVYTDSDAA